MRPPPIKPGRRIVNLMVTLSTGFLPWGIDWRHLDDAGSLQASIARSARRRGDYPLCCGNVYRHSEIVALVRRGFLTRGNQRQGWPQFIATERGKRFAWRHRFNAEGVGPVAFAMAGGARVLPLGHHHPDDDAYRTAEQAGMARDLATGWPS